MQTEISGAQYLDSSNYASLNPASGLCITRVIHRRQLSASKLRRLWRTTKNEHVGRFLSNNIADKSYICFPLADSQATGCIRPRHNGIYRATVRSRDVSCG
jgi:hypothetical protein